MPTFRINDDVRRNFHAIVALVVACFSSAALASPKSDAAFEEHVRPVLATQCVKCHGAKKQEGGLRLDSREAMLRGGESGPAIVPGKPEESLVVSAIRHEDFEMPPTSQLPPEQIESVVAWIRSGAHWPETGGLIRDASQAITDEDRNWWAFVPRKSPEVPEFPADAWSNNEIDRFVFKKLADNGMVPAERARRETLIRRLYFDVIGLPPSPEEVVAFVEDSRPDAYERLVDSLLDDDRHGEHWTRFWLDLVRYADSDGWKADAYRPNIWRYRDYVVNAFNEDKPYTEFVHEQLAGDECDAPSPDQLAAAGFLRLGIFEYNQRNALKHWDDILNEVTNVTGDVFLGMGMSCARCHDHKFDPILQTDYFKLRAYLEPLIWRDDVPYATEQQVSDHSKKLAAWKHATRDLREQIEELIRPYNERKMKATVGKFSLEIQSHYRTPADQQSSLDAQMAYLVKRQFSEEGSSPLSSMKGKDKKAYDALQKQLAEVDIEKPPALPLMMTVCNHTGECSPTTVPGEGSVVHPGTLTVLNHVVDHEPPSNGKRRTALAEWICLPDNPLTTRVIVNRIWKQHFGVGLVRSSSDFGRLGQRPTHAELLDWLANDFVEHGWTFKRLHKQILMSETWQQAAEHSQSQEYLRSDPLVELLWQRSTRRLTAEQIRDAALTVSGELNETVGGPSVDSSKPRRALYVKSFRNRPDPFLAEFDVAGGLNSVSDRNNTTTPTQALMMINGGFARKRASAFADRCTTMYSSVEGQIRYATECAWGRTATSEEMDAALRFVGMGDSSQQDSAEDRHEAFVDFCHILLNSNEFLYVD